MIENKPSDETEDMSAADRTGKKISRDELMSMASVLIRTLHRRTTAHRFKPSQHDNPRLQYARATIAAISAYGVIMKDDEIETLKQRVAALERVKGDVKP
jgi:hypothetical protein